MAIIRRIYTRICKRRGDRRFLRYIEQQLQGETFDEVLEGYLQEIV